MPHRPTDVWNSLPETLQQEIVQELSLITQEAIDEHTRTRRTPSSIATCLGVREAVQPAPGFVKPGEFAAPVCLARTGT